MYVSRIVIEPKGFSVANRGLSATQRVTKYSRTLLPKKNRDGSVFYTLISTRRVHLLGHCQVAVISSTASRHCLDSRHPSPHSAASGCLKIRRLQPLESAKSTKRSLNLDSDTSTFKHFRNFLPAYALCDAAGNGSNEEVYSGVADTVQIAGCTTVLQKQPHSINPSGIGRKNYGCPLCRRDHTDYGCENPGECVEAAKMLLDCLLSKWNPVIPGSDLCDILALSEQEKSTNGSGADKEDAKLTFDPNCRLTDFSRGFRLFASEWWSATHRQFQTPTMAQMMRFIVKDRAQRRPSVHPAAFAWWKTAIGALFLNAVRPFPTSRIFGSVADHHSEDHTSFTYPLLADALGGRASVPDAAIRNGRKADDSSPI
ncbi:hypothetical protein C8J57DRAFT_1230472 [Mycena rebaudengoi]|nr:hypothetical protein C8J57DRAFT_1230472 [Mycena rebaudengoi]